MKREFYRVYRKKLVMFLLVLCLFNMVLFLLSADPGKSITATGQALEEYIADYPEFLKNTAESGRVLSTLNMYQKGYASDSLQKAAKSYSELEGIVPEKGDNQGVVFLIQYKLADVFLLLFLGVIVADFLGERKKGLVNMVRATAQGRGVLYLQRVVILFFSSLEGAILFYGGSLIAMYMVYGGTDFSRCIQSLPEFMKCPYELSIMEFLFAATAIRTMGCFLAVFCFFLLISVLSTGAAYVVTAVLAVTEILLSLLLDSVSALSGLKFINLFTAILSESYFQDCCFLNVFGKAIPAWSGLLFFFCILALGFMILGFLIHGRRYVVNRKVGEGVAEKIAGFLERHAGQRTLVGWECYKLFVKQGGVFVILLVIGLHFSMSAKYDYLYYVEPMERLWYQGYEGELTQEKVADAQKKMEMFDKTIASLTEQYEQLISGRDFERANKVWNTLCSYKELREGLIPVMEDMIEGLQYIKRSGKSLSVIEPYTYDLLLQIDGQTKDRASFFVLIGIVGVASGVFAFEAQNNMRYSIRSLKRGRTENVLTKLCLVVVVCLTISTLLHLVQIYQIGINRGYENLSAPVQSLRFMREFVPYVSIAQYIILLLLVRGIMACGIGMLCTLVSRFCSDTITAVGMSAFLLAVPVLLAQLLPGWRMIDTLYLLGADFFH